MIFRNRTNLESGRLADMCHIAVANWPHDDLKVLIRYSRGAEFSGACYYATGRIFVNLGRANTYPYHLRTHIARAQTGEGCWYRDIYTVELADPYLLVLFIFLHEFYHWLVKRAGRNTRQKEAMCDRFAVRSLVERGLARVFDPNGRPVERGMWDIQDLDAFVESARRRRKCG